MSWVSIRPGIAISDSLLCLDRMPNSLFTSRPGILFSV